MNIGTTYSGPACLAVNANQRDKINDDTPVPDRYEPDDAEVMWTLFRR